jgi:hypothetical protein
MYALYMYKYQNQEVRVSKDHVNKRNNLDYKKEKAIAVFSLCVSRLLSGSNEP